jgi:probable selenate reductase FAD-binding subunit
MAQFKAYYRPERVEEVLQLLARPGVRTAIVAGGTHLNDQRAAPLAEEVVDLQALGLDGVSEVKGRLRLGAMTRLQSLVEDERVPALLREMAHREGPNTLRNGATLGGAVVVADPESELLAALLVHEAEVELQFQSGSRHLALADFLAGLPGSVEGGVVTAVSVVTSGQGSSERVARTPADRPIVAVVARQDEAGQIRLALCGVASTPILVKLDQLQNLQPPADFRGSSAYRREMAVVLSRRVVESLGGTTD